MPQRQLPIFPAGVTEINSRIAVQKEKGPVGYSQGHLPVCHHEAADVGSFRMLSRQMIVNGTVKPQEIVRALGGAADHGEKVRPAVSRARNARVP